MVNPIFCTINDLNVFVHENFSLSLPHLEIPAGKFIIILGENGAGKTTILRTILGQVPKTGTIEFPNLGELEKIPKLTRAQIMAFLPAQDHCAFNFKIHEFLELGFPAGSLYSTHEKKQRIEYVIQRLRIPSDFLQKHICSLSSGERKKIFLGRVMVNNADALLLDEPFSHLDPYNTKELIEHIKLMTAEGKSVLAVCHDIRAAFTHAHFVIGLKAGKLHGFGKAQDYLTPVTIQQLFGVDAIILKNENNENVLTLNV